MNFSVSFVVPVYNTDIEKFKKCIMSIKDINIKDFEIIVIDDGSNSEKSNQYKKILKNIKNSIYIKNDNHGVSFSRNCGIDISTKDYIMFIDSDDYIISGLFNNKIIVKNYDIVIFDLVNVNNGRLYNYSFEEGKIDWIDLMEQHLTMNNFSTPCARLYKRFFLINNNLKFKTCYVQGEDAYFNLECLTYKPLIFYYKKQIYCYNYSSFSTVNRWKNNFEKSMKIKYDFYLKEMDCLKKFNFKNKDAILSQINNSFIKSYMHSYLILLKLNDKEKIKIFSKSLKKYNINLKKLKFKQKIYYIIIKKNYFFIRLLLKIIIHLKKI